MASSRATQSVSSLLDELDESLFNQPESSLLNEEEAVKIIQKLIEPLNTVYKEGVMLPPYTSIDENGQAYISRPDAFDPSKLDPSKLATKTGMSTECSNKLCSFFEYGLSCKAIGIGMSKVFFQRRLLLHCGYVTISLNEFYRSVLNISWVE